MERSRRATCAAVFVYASRMSQPTDTIAAIASAPGAAGVGVVRVSG
ncbi:hypothetical protein UU5_14108, partial [Rhodanobacter sp. 115]